MLKRILIVEDESITAQDLAELLKINGFEVLGPVSTAEKAVEIADSDAPDLILMDIRLAGVKTGIEAAVEIKETSQVPVVFLTAHVNNDLIAQTKKVDPYGFVAKPFQPKELISVIDIALIKSEANKKLKRVNKLLKLSHQVTAQFLQSTDYPTIIKNTYDLVIKSGLYRAFWIYLMPNEFFDEIFFVKTDDGFETNDSAFIKEIMVRRPIENLNWQGDIAAVDECVDVGEDEVQFLCNKGNGSILGAISLGDTSFGYMGVGLDKSLIHDENEQSLFSDFKKDVASGIKLIISGLKEKQKETALRQNIERFKVAFMASPEPMTLTSMNTGKYLEINQAFENVSKFKKEDIIGKTSYEIGIWANSTELDYVVDEVKKFGKIENVICNFRFADGSINPILLSAQLITLESEPILFTVSRFREYWDNYREAVQQQERFLTLVANQTKQMIYDYYFYTDELRFTGAINAVTGYDSYEIEKLSYKTWLSMIHPDDLALYDKAFHAEKQNEVVQVQYRIKTKSSKYKYVEERASLIKGQNRIVDRRLGSIFDISEQLEVFNLVREKSEQIKLILDSAPMAVWTLDLDLNFSSAFGAGRDLLSIPYQEIIGGNFTELVNRYNVDVTEVPSFDEIITGSRNSGVAVVGDRKINIYVRPLFNELGQPKGIIGITFDVTEQIQAKDENLKLSKVIEQSPTTVVITDIEGNIEYVNPFFTQNSGYTLDEVKGKNPRLLQTGMTSKEEYAEMWSKILSGDVWRGEFFNKRKDGTLYWERATISPILNSKGEIKQFLAIKEDITEFKKMQENLYDSEEKLGLIIEATNNVLYKLDYSTRKYSYMSSAIVAVTGYTVEELNTIGFDKVVIKSDVYSNYSSEEYDIVKNSGSYYFKGEWNADYLIATKSGDHKWLSDHAHTVKNSFGEVVGSVGVLQDISARKKVEEEAKIQKIKVDQLFENSPVPIVQLDVKHSILRVNKSFEKLFGYSFDEIKYKILENVIVPEEFRVESAAKLDKMGGESGFVVESMRQKKDGSRILVQIFGVPITIEGEIVGAYRMYVDQTDRVRVQNQITAARTQAEEMNNLKSNLLANVSHELRTPLNGIMGYSELLQAEFEDTEVVRMSGKIFSSATRLLETLNLILDFSNLETEAVAIEKREVDVVPIVFKVARIYKDFAIKKNITFELQSDSEEVIGYLDDSLLRKILSNVLSNAIKFTTIGGVKISIELKSYKSTEVFVIKVKDTGIGIAKEQQDKIFMEFRQVSEGMSRGYEGLGLGLTVTKRLVETMGGRLKLESEVNYGTTISIMFPTYKNSNENLNEIINEDDTMLPELGFGAEVKYRVLYVEDDDTSQELVGLYLDDICELDYAWNSGEAYNLAEKNEYDLVLIDINLGRGPSGIEIMKTLKATQKYKDVPFLAITAYALNKDKQEFISEGCAGYLAKPINRTDLREQILHLLHADQV